MANKTYCYADQHFENNGSGEALFLALIRERGNRPLEVGGFLLDLGCTGVKDAFYAQIDQDELEAFKADAFRGGCREEEAAWGRKLVEEGLGYAKSLGLKPHRDYKKAARVFGGVRTSDCDTVFRFGGEDGKPLYIQGKHSDETARHMIEHLARRLGADGFHFIAEVTTALSDSPDERIDYFLDEAEAGRRKKAQFGIEELLEEYPEEAKVHFAQGVLHVYKKKHEDALDAFDRAVELNPEMDEAWMNKASAHRQLGQSYDMVLALRKVCELTPSDDELHLQAKDSLAYFEEVIQGAEGISTEAYLVAEGLFREAADLHENEEHEAAISVIVDNPARLPENERTLTLLGACYRALEQWDTARDCFKKALEINPEHFTARINLMMLDAAESGQGLSSMLAETLEKIQKDPLEE